MTITFSTHALEAMGFSEVIAQGDLAASFMSVTVYEARGIVVPDDVCEAKLARVAGTEYRIAITQSVNAGCQALIGDDYDESEPEFCQRVKSKGPYMLIAVGPTEFFECAAGRLMRHEDGSVTTYDSFPRVREALRSLEQRVIPPVLAAMTCALNKPDRYVSLRRLEQASSGRCQDGTRLHDMRLEGKAEVYVSYHLDQVALAGKLADVATKAPRLNQRAAKFFALGIGEGDQLKKFLYFFLALEIEANAVFKRINHEAQAIKLLSGTSSPSTVTVNLLKNQMKSLNNIFDKFVWCAVCVWTNLNEQDVSLFMELKKARDDIAHGDASEPPAGFANSAELLAQKVLWL